MRKGGDVGSTVCSATTPYCPMGTLGPDGGVQRGQYSPRRVELKPPPRTYLDEWGMIIQEDTTMDNWMWDVQRPKVVLLPPKDGSQAATEKIHDDPWVVEDAASLHWFPKGHTGGAVSGSSSSTDVVFDSAVKAPFDGASMESQQTQHLHECDVRSSGSCCLHYTN